MVVRDGRDFFNYFIILRNIHRFYIGGGIGKAGKMALSCTSTFLRVFWEVFVGAFCWRYVDLLIMIFI